MRQLARAASTGVENRWSRLGHSLQRKGERRQARRPRVPPAHYERAGRTYLGLRNFFFLAVGVAQADDPVARRIARAKGAESWPHVSR
jgi:hypothetical protein